MKQKWFFCAFLLKKTCFMLFCHEIHLRMLIESIQAGNKNFSFAANEKMLYICSIIFKLKNI